MAQSARKASGSASPYTLQVPVDEVSLTFRAFDANGKPLTTLKPTDLKLLDDDKPQDNVVAFQSYQDLPIRAGFLFDSSISMFRSLNGNSAIIRLYASRLLRKGYDSAFVMQFDTDTLTRQSWTDNDGLIGAGAAAIRPRNDRIPVTALYDSLYTTCRDMWPRDHGDETGNFILLFSDGLDNDSHVYLSEAVDMCQRSRTAIYVLSNSRKAPEMRGRRQSPFTEGQQPLEALAEQTGGRVYFAPHGDQIWRDLQQIEAEQRNQYLLAYKPTGFKADGAFHTISLRCTMKGTRIVSRSGYYAFPRR
jgi:VWFA-related protein